MILVDNLGTIHPNCLAPPEGLDMFNLDTITLLSMPYSSQDRPLVPIYATRGGSGATLVILIQTSLSRL